MKRFEKIKKFLGDASTKEQVKRMVLEDWLKAEYKGLGAKNYVIIKISKEHSKIFL
jgi:hypothetical protein